MLFATGVATTKGSWSWVFDFCGAGAAEDGTGLRSALVTQQAITIAVTTPASAR
jgi:hypothetical protein